MERAEEAKKKWNTAKKKKKKEAEKVLREEAKPKAVTETKEAKAPAAGDDDLEDFSSRRS
jgi:hypothetical protein